MFTISMLPHSVGRMMALPVGLALASLGYSLWREGPTTLARVARRVQGSRLESAGAE